MELKAREALKGVGDTAEEHWQQGSLALHYRRPMTLEEAMKLPPPVKISPAYRVWANAQSAALEARGIINPQEMQEIKSQKS